MSTFIYPADDQILEDITGLSAPSAVITSIARSAVDQTALPANMMDHDGDIMHVQAWGTFAANANTKRIKWVYDTSTWLDTTALAIDGGSWRFEGQIVRTGAAAQTYSGIIFITDGAGVTTVRTVSGTDTISFTANKTMKFTGEATADNDIVQLYHGQQVNHYA